MAVSALPAAAGSSRVTVPLTVETNVSLICCSTETKPFATFGAFDITDEALAQAAEQYKALLAE